MKARGLSLLEIIIAIGVFAVLAAGLLNLVIVPLYSSGNVAGQERGMYLGQEGIEAAKAIRNTGWNQLTLGAHGLLSTGGKWTFSGASDNSPLGCVTGSADCYTRVVTVSAVSRSGAKCDGDIVTSGGCVDQRTKLIGADVTWTTGFGAAQALHYATYVTNWDNFSRAYDTAADFGTGGPSNMIAVVGGEDVVTVAPGEAGWTSSGGVNVTSTTDVDWNAGTPSSVTVSGTGVASSITMTPSLAWTDYFVPDAWTETTNTDFNDGTFVNTAVADTGNQSAVVLNTAVDWAVRTAPQTANAYNDVFLYSSAFGFAVGNGGVIAKWDGASWTAMTSPVATALYGVAIVSTSDAWAVGASGRILHWNGATWIATTYGGGTPTFRHVKMLSASEGYAVGDAGVTYRWNGVTWTAESSGTADNLTSVSGVSPAGSPATITETTDADFNSKTAATNTVVTGSGTAGSVSLTQATNWLELSSPTTNRLNSTHIYSASLGFAVGGGGNGSGTISHWDGTSWTNDLTNGGRIFNSVRVTSTTDAWAVAARYQDMRRWDGTTWNSYTNANLSGWGTNAMNSVNCYDTGHCVIVGAGGRYSFWNGTTWTTTQTVVNTPNLFDVQYLSSTFAIAVGASGRSYTWNGSAWTQRTQIAGNPQLNGVNCSSATFCIAVASNGTSYSWNGGAAWTTLAATGATQLNEIAVFSTTSAVAVGTDSGATTDRIYRWNGATWAVESTNPAASDILAGLSFLSANYGVAVGAGGAIIEYAPHYPTSGTSTYESSILNAGTAASWGTLSWGETLPAGTTVTIATRTGPTAAPDVTWSLWSGEQTVNTGVAVTSPRNQYLEYRATLSTTDAAATPTLDSVTFTYDTSPATLFAVTSTGVIIGRNGAGWSQVTSFAGTAFADIDCLSAANCWAVAAAGRIYHWNGTSWTLNGTYGAGNFNGVSMVSPSLGWAVGAGGIIYKYDGSTWTSVTSPTANALSRVFAVSSTDAAAVGAAGTLAEYGLHFATTGTYTSHTFDAGASKTWSTFVWDKTTPGATAVTGVTVSVSVNGTTWSSVSCSASPCDISSLTGRYFYYAVTETTPALDRVITPRLEDVTVTYNAPLLYDYYDLYMSSPTDGWAAGFDSARTSGGIAHWDGTSWTNVTVPVAFYNGIGGSGPNDIWADDDGGDTMLHWNGATWTAYSITALTGSSWMNDVKCLKGDSTNCRAAGSAGLMLRWNAGTNAWVVENVGTTATIQWISYVSANELFAVGTGGTVLHYLNGTWTNSVVGSATTKWQGVAMNSATDGWIVGGDPGDNGNNAVMRHWNGSTWSAVTLPGIPANYELQNVNCLNANYCWAGGGLTTTEVVILKWDGTSWTVWLENEGAGQTGVQTSPVISTYRVKAMWSDTTTHAWAVASNKGFNEYKASYPTTATWTSPALDSGAASTVWNNVSWDVTQPLSTNITIATRTSADGVAWSAWSGEYSDLGGTDIASPPARYLQYRATFTSGNQVSTASLDEVRFIRSALTPEPLYDIAGASATDVWSVGDAGVIAHFNGSVWTLVTSPTAATLRGVDVWSASLAFAVGAGGKILKYDGTSWTLDASPTFEDLYDVDFVSATEAWAVGTSGTILKWNGSVWTAVASGTTAGLKSVSMISSSSGFAVGAGGVIRRYNGTNWTTLTVTSPTSQNLNGVNCYDLTRCAAVGDVGTIVMWNGTAWALSIPSNGELTSRLNDVRFQSLTSGWAVGDFGATVQWDGTSWTNVESKTGRNLYSVNYPGGGLAWITGEVGSLLSVSLTNGTNGVFTGEVLDTGSTTSVFQDAFFIYSSVPPAAITVAFRTGDVAIPDGTWSAWSSEQTLPSADTSATVAVPPSLSPHQYVQFRLTLTTTDPLVVPFVDSYTVTYQ